jgi:transcriptional regulator GlxA family with amidase domain
VREWKARREGLIKKHHARHGVKLERLLRASRDSPEISEADIPRYQNRLKTLASVASALCDAFGVSETRYEMRNTSIHGRVFARMPQLVRSAVRYASTHYDKACHVRDIAAALRCHPDYLSRVFKQHAKMELSDYVHHVRIDRAKALLKQGTLTVGEVSDRCGYSDTSHFVKVFKRLVKETPLSYSRRNSEFPHPTT